MLGLCVDMPLLQCGEEHAPLSTRGGAGGNVMVYLVTKRLKYPSNAPPTREASVVRGATVAYIERHAV